MILLARIKKETHLLLSLSTFSFLAHCLISYGTIRKYLTYLTDTVHISSHVLRTSTPYQIVVGSGTSLYRVPASAARTHTTQLCCKVLYLTLPNLTLALASATPALILIGDECCHTRPKRVAPIDLVTKKSPWDQP